MVEGENLGGASPQTGSRREVAPPAKLVEMAGSKKRKSVQFAEDEAEAGEDGKFRPPEDHFVKRRGLRPLQQRAGGKELVVLQVPDEVDLAQVDGRVLALGGGSGLAGSQSDGDLAVHQEDEVYAGQFLALVPAAGGHLTARSAEHMLVLTKALRGASGSAASEDPVAVATATKVKEETDSRKKDKKKNKKKKDKKKKEKRKS